MPPNFIDKLEPQNVLRNSTVHLRSTFEGTPPFTVKWFKDDEELFTSPSCVITINEASSTILLHSVGASQIGIYSCQVTNQAGTEKCAAELLVKGWTTLFFVHHLLSINNFSSINSIFFLHSTDHVPNHLTYHASFTAFTAIFSFSVSSPI